MFYINFWNVYFVLFSEMTDQEIVAQCMIFFLAGYETTASTLSFMAHSLSLNPDIQKKLCQEIKDVLGDVCIISLSRM